MVGTRPKNNLGRIPYRTKIDLTKKPSSTKIAARKRLPMADPKETTPTEEQTHAEPTYDEADLLVNLGEAGEEEQATEGDNEEEQELTTFEQPTEETSDKVGDRLRKIKKKKATPPFKKSKASSSVAGSSPDGTENEEEGGSEEVSSGEQSEKEQEEEQEEKDETKEEEAADEEAVEEDEPPAKRAKTPSRSAKGKYVSGTARDDFKVKEIVVPKKLDFKVLKQLGMDAEVRQKFEAIRWEKFLDLETDVYGDLVREFYDTLEVTTNQDNGPRYIKFKILGIEYQLTPS